jgi:hypothetical protein
LTPHELHGLLAPFGRVRMIASPAGAGSKDEGTSVPPRARPPLSEGPMSGAFIVAEVRT